MRYRLALLLALLPGPVAAQRLVPVARGTASITAADVQRRIGIIADDSMLGRATPSPQLDAVAAYVAGEFQRFGLKPGGDSGTYFQHYPLEVSRFDPESSTVRIMSRTPGSWRAGQDVLLVEGQPPAGAPAAPAVVITGSADAAGALDSTAVTGKVVFLAYGPALNAIAPKVLPLRPLAVMLVAAFPDSIWAKLPGHAASVSVRNPSSESGPAIPGVFVVRTATAGALLAQGGATADSLRAWGDRPLAAHPLMDVTLQLDVRQRVLQHASAPNAIGILEGSDPVLKKEYVLFTAHMDHIGTPSAGEGCTARGADSICNGADDDGSGTVAVIEVAQALPGVHDRERRGAEPVGERVLRRPSHGPARRRDRRLEHRHGGPQFERHGRRDRPRALQSRSDARQRRDGSPRAAHQAGRRSLAAGGSVLPLGPLQFRQEGRAHPFLHDRVAS